MRVKCDLCKLSFINDDFEEHYLKCSSRTEKCEKCFKYIKIFNIKKHQL